MRRRGLLALGVVAATVVAVGGGALALLQPGWRRGRLAARGRRVFAAVGGSVFPSSTGANPQLSIYALVNRLAQGLATQLGGREVVLA